jgi:hypothetical protein
MGAPAAGLDPYRAYARVHAFYQLCRFTSPPQPLPVVAMQLPFVLAALIFPSKATLIGSALANIVTIMLHIPAVVDMDHWAMYSDLALLMMMGASVPLFSRVMRSMFAFFYAATGIWKLTIDHSDPRLSCSSLLLVQTLCGWLPTSMLNPTLVSLVATNAPHVTFVVETGIAPLMLSSSRLLNRLGVLLIIALHVGIMVAPLPLSISDFGAMTSSRLMWVFPVAATRAVAEIESAFSVSSSPSSDGSARGVAIVFAIVSAVTAMICKVHGSAERVVAHFAFTALLALICRAIYLDISDDAKPTAVAPPSAKLATATVARDSPRHKFLATLLVGMSFFYSFGMPMLGLIDVGGPLMFSHIKMHGGSNHYFLPTGLIQTWMADKSPLDASLGPLASFAGGVVRIEHSTSAYLNGAYPGEVTKIEPEPLTRTWLKQAGHFGRMFTNPGVRPWNIRGKNLHIGGGLTSFGLGLVFAQAPNGANGAFIKYTLPALELRMMLVSMRLLNESFVLEYTRITGAPPQNDHVGAEAWRAKGCGRRVTFQEKSGGTRVCSTVNTCSDDHSVQKPCATDELAMLVGDDEPGWFARKMVLSNPYPILEPAGRYCGSSG